MMLLYDTETTEGIIFMYHFLDDDKGALTSNMPIFLVIIWRKM